MYFDELSEELIMEICRYENPDGVVISVGGQTPNNRAVGLAKAGVNILGHLLGRDKKVLRYY